mmetsp:Transcript_16622/g.51985  ORF Transcript_16622/g.51985 Transcript_16622/m.51985 type:complete len:226 (-) Transcript_16622:396-1073(-)
MVPIACHASASPSVRRDETDATTAAARRVVPDHRRHVCWFHEGTSIVSTTRVHSAGTAPGSDVVSLIVPNEPGPTTGSPPTISCQPPRLPITASTARAARTCVAPGTSAAASVLATRTCRATTSRPSAMMDETPRPVPTGSPSTPDDSSSCAPAAASRSARVVGPPLMRSRTLTTAMPMVVSSTARPSAVARTTIEGEAAGAGRSVARTEMGIASSVRAPPKDTG